VEAGICPFCGRGPFTVLAGHTNKVHAVDRRELRELAGLTYSASIIPAEYREQLRLRRQGQSPPDGTLNRGKRYRISPAGREAQLSGYRRWSKTAAAQTQRLAAAARNGDLRRRPHPCPVCRTIVPSARRLTCSPECRRVIRRRTQAKAAATRARWRVAALPDVEARAAAGETQSSIAAFYEVSRGTIGSMLRAARAQGGAPV
jgi:predicted nucleic acid-binding Zn ribbon protein